MAVILVISDCDALTKSIERYFRFVRHETVHTRRMPALTPTQPPQESEVFKQLAGWIEAHTQPDEGDAGLRRAVIFTTLYDPRLANLHDLSPISTSTGQGAVVAMLVLAFPEAQWVFITPHWRDWSDSPQPAPIRDPFFKRAHLLGAANTLSSVLRVHGMKYVPLFDPAGLRHAIRAQIKKHTDDNKNPVAPYVPLRLARAAAVDEEEAYAYFMAYTAYRLGYQTHAVSSYGMMEEVFGKAAASYPELIFEDLYLNFADKPPRVHLSELANRELSFPGVSEARLRIFITVGHRRNVEEAVQERNKAYLWSWERGAKAGGRRYAKTLYKPLSGIHDLWRKSGLRKQLRWNKGLADDYNWPPVDGAAGEPVGSHSAPGRLLEIADQLLARANRILRGAQTVPEAVHGALLALDAQEYLGHRTPTTSLEALALKHILEVTAECKFYGVEYNKDVKSRFGEVERDLKSIGKWFRKKTRRLSVLNAEMGIVSALVLKFREYNQFDEEQECLARLRRLNRQLWSRKHRAWTAPLYLFRWYVDSLLGSVLVFILAIVGWVALLSALFSKYCNCHGVTTPNQPTESDIVLHGLGHAITTFFAIQPAHTTAEIEQIGYTAFALGLLAVLAGFVHLGIFVSHLYSLIARR